MNMKTKKLEVESAGPDLSRLDDIEFAMDSIIRDLTKNGCAVPDVVGVMYNHGTKIVYETNKDGTPKLDKNGKKTKIDQYPILTTVVNFADGTKTTVVNSSHDSVPVRDKYKTQKEFDDAMNCVKENGFVYAFVKRILSGRYTNDKEGIKHAGYGRILTEYVTNAYDCQEAEIKRAEQKAAAKKRIEAEKANAKGPNPSLAETVRVLAATVEKLAAKVDSLSEPKSSTKNKKVSK